MSDVFLIRISNSALSVLIGFGFLIYPRYIREILATFLCCSYCGLCESLVRSLRRFPSHKLRVFKEKKISTPWWSIQLLPLKLKETQAVCLYLVVNPRKKESVDSELARGRVSKFYWWVAIRSWAWGLVSLIVWTSILSR